MPDEQYSKQSNAKIDGGNYSESIGKNYIEVQSGATLNIIEQGISNEEKTMPNLKFTNGYPSPIISNKLGENSSKRLAFAIAGSIDKVDQEKLEAIVSLLQKMTGDTSLEIRGIQKGSIKIILGGSEEGLRKIEELFESGNLIEVLGSKIEYVHFLDDDLENQQENQYKSVPLSDNIKDGNIVLHDLNKEEIGSSNLHDIFDFLIANPSISTSLFSRFDRKTKDRRSSIGNASLSLIKEQNSSSYIQADLVGTSDVFNVDLKHQHNQRLHKRRATSNWLLGREFACSTPFPSCNCIVLWPEKHSSPLAGKAEFERMLDYAVLRREGSINLPDTSVSRFHAVITCYNYSFFCLTDIGSRNGTLLNGRRIKSRARHKLHDQDFLQFGQLKAKIFIQNRENGKSLLKIKFFPEPETCASTLNESIGDTAQFA